MLVSSVLLAFMSLLSSQLCLPLKRDFLQSKMDAPLAVLRQEFSMINLEEM